MVIIEAGEVRLKLSFFSQVLEPTELIAPRFIVSVSPLTFTVPRDHLPTMLCETAPPEEFV